MYEKTKKLNKSDKMGKINVKELVNFLKKYPEDTPVSAFISNISLPPKQSEIIVSMLVVRRIDGVK